MALAHVATRGFHLWEARVERLPGAHNLDRPYRATRDLRGANRLSRPSATQCEWAGGRPHCAFDQHVPFHRMGTPDRPRGA